VPAPTILSVPSLDRWLESVRAAVDTARSPAGAAAAVQATLSRLLADTAGVARVVDELRAESRRRPARVLVEHVEPESPFTVQVFRWPPGWTTSIHDHVSWGVVAVLLGAEQEQLFRIDEQGRPVPRSRRVVIAGECVSFVPPNDVHQVCAPEPTLSLHVYGADLSITGGSTRRRYPEGG
jgi:predicted metal-dependent enzyme (double-stranded beta helix superfamily)